MKASKCLVVMAVVLALLLAACGQPTIPEPTVVPSEPTAGPTQEPVPITLTWWTELGTTCCSDTRSDFIPQDIMESGDLGEWLIEQWHRLHPEYDYVTIEMIQADTANENAILKDRIMAGDTPNIIEGFAGRVGELREIAVPLEDYFTLEMKDDYLPGRWEGLFHNGHIPMIGAVGAFYYPVINASLFERAGVEVPEPWHQYTWEEFKAIGEAVKALDDGSYLACFFAGASGGLQWDWEPFAGAGVSLFENDDYSHVTFNSPAAVEILTELIDLEAQGYLVPNPTSVAIYDCIDYWKEGKIAVFFSNLISRSTMIAAVQAGVSPEEWEVIPLLPISYGDGVPLFVGGYYNQGVMVTDATPESSREAAFSFAQYVSTWPFMTNGPLRLPLLQSQIDAGTMPSEEEAAALDYILETGLAECGFSEPGFNQIRQLWIDEVAAAFLGTKTPEEALIDFEGAANAVLE